jgi:hypothetical protein
MSKIYKYTLSPGEQEISLPNHALLVFAALDGEGKSCVWAQVDPDSQAFARKVQVVATGQEYDEKEWIYTFSWKDGPFIWHLLIEKMFYIARMPAFGQ